MLKEPYIRTSYLYKYLGSHPVEKGTWKPPAGPFFIMAAAVKDAEAAGSWRRQLTRTVSEIAKGER